MSFRVYPPNATVQPCNVESSKCLLFPSFRAPEHHIIQQIYHYYSRSRPATTAANPKYAAFCHAEVSLAAKAAEVLELTIFALTPQYGPKQTVCVPAGRVAEATLVMIDPWSSYVFDMVCQPDWRVLVVGNPRSSHPVLISYPLPEPCEDGESEGSAKEDGVDAGSWESVSHGLEQTCV